MTLDQWLAVATRGLSVAAVLRVEAEITSHYESALEAAAADALSEPDAMARAIQSLGDPDAANRAYRKILLTKLEVMWLTNFSRTDREQNSLLNSRVRQAIAFSLIAVAVMLLATTRRVDSFPYILTTVLSIDLLPAVFATVTYRRLRQIRWMLVVAVVGAMWWFGMRERWGVLVLGAAFAWIDWIKASIRRKLPRDQWPASLTL